MATKTLTENDGPDDDVIIKEAPPEHNVLVEEPKPDTGDRRLTSQDDDEDEESGKSLAEKEAIRERRRHEKADRKVRRDTAIGRDKLEMDFLRKRNDDLERRISGVESHAQQSNMASVDRQIKEALNEVSMAEQVISKAVTAGNGSDVTQAMRYRDQAIARANQLNGAKQAQQGNQQPADQIDGMTKHYADEFLKENTWYDVQGRDEESAIVLAVDQALMRDGYNPQTEEYWAELRKRSARRLPDRFGDDKVERSPRGGPALGGGKEYAPASTRREVYISADRKQALVDAGVWDDPTLRQKYVKRYMEYDKQNRA